VVLLAHQSSTIPTELPIDKGIARKFLPWNHTSAIAVDNVICGLWQDNSTVFLISTIHDLQTGRLVNRRRPGDTSTNATSTHKVFRSDVRKLLVIPSLIDDYNQHMGGVDIADQLRAYCSTQQPSLRN